MVANQMQTLYIQWAKYFFFPLLDFGGHHSTKSTLFKITSDPVIALDEELCICYV